MTVMIGGHSALGNIRVNRILYTYPNGVYLAQISPHRWRKRPRLCCLIKNCEFYP